MRILICYPWLDLGGAPNSAMSTAMGLRQLGHDVFFFTREGGIYGEQLSRYGIPMISAPYHPFLPHMYHLNRKAYAVMLNAIDEHSIDIVHAFHRNPYFLAQFAALRRDIPVVFTSVWFLEAGVFPVFPGRVVFVAEEFRDDAKARMRGEPRETAVIPNRIDLERFRPGIDPSGFVREKALQNKGWKIAFMSRIDAMKMGSLRYAVEAVRILAERGREVTLAIAGGGTSFNELSAIAAEVNSEAGRRCVRLLGPVLETPEFLSWADIAVGVGRCVWEGMACGKPAMVVGEKGLAGVVEPSEAGKLAYHNFAGRNLTEPVSPVLLADRIEEVMTDGGRYTSLSEFSLAYVLENYDYRTGAERYSRIYEKALSDVPLSGSQKRSLLMNNLLYGYGRRLYLAWKRKLRGYVGRGRPEDREGH